MTGSETLSDRVRSALALVPRQLLVGGKWADAADGRELVSVNPATGTELLRVACAGPQDAARAVAAARKAFDSDSRWRRMTPSARGRMLHRVGDLIVEHADDLALLDCLDNGKPLRVARSGDVPMAADLFHYMSGWATRTGGSVHPLSRGTPGRHLAWTTNEPVGVVAAIIPWNFPLYMAAAKLAPALAAGCAVILKPAEQTPLSALALGALCQRAGLPPGALGILTGYGDVGAALAASPGVDKVTFTGSTEVGREIVRAAAGNLKRVGLELGGKSPNLIFADADLPAAIDTAVEAIFFNQGECCVAGSRLLVQRPVFDEVVAEITARARAIRLGNGLHPDTAMGPLISAGHHARVTGYLEAARAGGATVAGGESVPAAGYFCTPVVVTGAADDAPIVREEVFGPVLVARAFEGEDEAVAAANDSPYGLAAGVFTGDLARGHRLARRLRAGTVWLNTWHVLDPAVPFGGTRESGWGREMGREGVEAYLESRTVLADLGAFPANRT